MSAAVSIREIATDQPDVGFDNGVRGRWNAWFFTRFDRYIAFISGPHKRAAFGDVDGSTIVEIGAGVGANFEFVPRGSRFIAVEPNLAMQPALRSRAADRSIDIEILTADGAMTTLDADSVDDVFCSLVLCTVDDQDAVLAEARRILRPGGRFRFVEHVVARRWSPRHWLQRVIRRPWSWIYEGCDLCRDTGAAIERAGFTTVEMRRGRLRGSCFVPVNTSLYGIATK